MQKKLLLLALAMNFVIIQADTDEAQTNNEKDYTKYTEQQRKAYKEALVAALAGDEKALDAADQKNKQTNDDEEKESRKQQYDGNPGYWATEPSVNSEIGRKYQAYAQHKEAKNKIDQDLSKEMKDKKELFNKDVLSALVYHVDTDKSFVMKNCLWTLQDCKSDLNCYEEKGLSSKLFTDPQFGSKYEQRLYATGVNVASQHTIVLTSEEMKIILTGNPQTKKVVQEIQNGLDEISKVRNDILNDKK